MRTVILFILNLLILTAFALATLKILPPEYRFEYAKLFAGACLVFLIIEWFKKGLHRKRVHQISGFLSRIAYSEQKEIDELPPDHPDYPVYQSLLTILEKYTTKEVEPEHFQPVEYLAPLWKSDSPPLMRISAFFKKLSGFMPNAEFFLFAISHNKIYLLEQYGSEELRDVDMELLRNTPKPFSEKTDFSGACLTGKQNIITNELKNDPNFGQFLSRNNPNLPIYGAVFPIGNHNPSGFLWIRDGSQTLEFVKERSLFFETCSGMIERIFFQEGKLLSFESCNFEDCFLHFQNKSRILFAMAETQKQPFCTALTFFKPLSREKTLSLKSITSKITEILPILSTCTIENEFIYFSILGLNQKECLLLFGKIQDLLHHELFPESESAPLGESNTGFSCHVPTPSEDFSDFLTEANEAMKTALATGPNRMRVHRLQKEQQ
jgi:hypothetical protein